MIAVHFFFP